MYRPHWDDRDASPQGLGAKGGCVAAVRVDPGPIANKLPGRIGKGRRSSSKSVMKPASDWSAGRRSTASGRSRVHFGPPGLAPSDQDDDEERSRLNYLARYCRESERLPPEALNTIYVRFDARGEDVTRHERFRLDLSEHGSVLMFRILSRFVGFVNPPLGWRLIGGQCRLSFYTESSGYEAGMREGSTYVLVKRLRGGGPMPTPPDTGEGSEEPSPVSSDPVIPSPATPEVPHATTAAHDPEEAGSSGLPPPGEVREPSIISPPYRPMDDPAAEGPQLSGPVGGEPPATNPDGTPGAAPQGSAEAPPQEIASTPGEVRPQTTADPGQEDPWVLRRIELEVQRRLAAAGLAAAGYSEAGTPAIAPIPRVGSTAPDNMGPDNIESHVERSVNFEAPPPQRDRMSLRPRPRSERAAGSESRWRRYENGDSYPPETAWEEERLEASQQEPSRSPSPPTPDYRHQPTHSYSRMGLSNASSAARRGAAGSTFSIPDGVSPEDAEDETLSYWESDEVTTLTDAPSPSLLDKYFKRHMVDQAVIDLVHRVRELPWQANAASPHTNCFNPNVERPPLRVKFNSTKKLSDTRTAQKDFKFFNDPRLTAPTEHEQLLAWVSVRAEMCITLRQCVDTRCAGPEFLTAIRDELNRMMGHTQALPQLAALIVQGLQAFVTLASNCLLLACDMHWCPEYSPLTALQTVQRKAGQSLVDCFANIELLMLQAKNREQESREYLYTDLCRTDRQVITDLHRYAVHAIETGDQPWAGQVALEFDRACSNARAYARTVPERERPALLQLQSIAFQNNIIGLDTNLSLGYANGRPQYHSFSIDDPPPPTSRLSRRAAAKIRNPVAPVTTRSGQPFQAEPPRPRPDAPPRAPPPPPPMPQQLQNLQPLNRSDHPAGPRGNERSPAPHQPEPRNNPKGDPNTNAQGALWWIDMMEVRRAAEGSDPARKRLATIVWPTDDGRSYAENIECKPTPVFENDGRPAYFPDGRPMVSFNHKKACRYCSIYAAGHVGRPGR